MPKGGKGKFMKKNIFKKIATLVAAVTTVVAMGITVSAADPVYHVAGVETLTGVAWDPAQNEMTAKGDGTYEITFTNIAKGDHDFKVVEGSDWNGKQFNLEGDASSGGANAKVTVTEDGSTVVITFDGTKASVEVKAPQAGGSTTDSTENTTTAAPSKEEPSAPKTGDATPIIAMAAVAAVAGALVVASRKNVVNE